MFIQTKAFDSFSPHIVKWNHRNESVKEKEFTTFSLANGFAESMKKRGFRVTIIPVFRRKEELVKHYLRRIDS